MTQSNRQHRETCSSRRDFLMRAGGGFGSLALAHMLATDIRSSPASRAVAHRPALARRVIFLFMDGGPSHIDTFDPKPEVNRRAGKPLPKSIKPAFTPMGVSNNPILASHS